MQHVKNKENKKSHILIELIILLLVIAVIGVFAIPKLTNMLSTSKITSANKDAEIVSIAAQAWLTEQEIAGTVLTLNDKNELSESDTKKITSTVKALDETTAKTVKITLKSSDAPLCYQVLSVSLTKNDCDGSYTIK